MTGTGHAGRQRSPSTPLLGWAGRFGALGSQGVFCPQAFLGALCSIPPCSSPSPLAQLRSFILPPPATMPFLCPSTASLALPPQPCPGTNSKCSVGQGLHRTRALGSQHPAALRGQRSSRATPGQQGQQHSSSARCRPGRRRPSLERLHRASVAGTGFCLRLPPGRFAPALSIFFRAGKI